jgi:hypothetical protein
VVSRFPLTILVGLGFGISALVLVGNGWVIPASFFTPVSIVVSVLSVALLMWDALLWRCLPERIVRRPDLRGTWRGEILRKEMPPIVVYLVVDQTFSRVAYRTFTEESCSASMAASLDKSNGQFQLVALYSNTPDLRVQDRSRPHRGAVWLRVHEETLEGAYWTDRDTKGELRFARISRKAAGSFASAMALPAAPRPAAPSLGTA